MKLCSWNCNGGFKSKNKYKKCCEFDICWSAEKDRKKGLGLFVSNNIDVEYYRKIIKNEINDCIYIKIKNGLTIIGIWAKPYNGRSTYKNYVKTVLNIIEELKEILCTEDCILIGDFNSNKIFDKLCGEENHSLIVEKLRNLGYSSLYHDIYNEEFGAETISTHKNRGTNKEYHVDYCFYKKTIKSRIINFHIDGDYSLSDHKMLKLEII